LKNYSIALPTSAKEPYIPAKGPYDSAKESHVSAKEPYKSAPKHIMAPHQIVAQLFNVTWSIHKRALFLRKRVLHLYIEKHISAKEPHISTEKPCKSATKQDFCCKSMLAQLKDDAELFNLSLGICKRAMNLCK